MNNNVRIARQLVRIAKMLAAGNGVADAIENAIAPYGFTLSDVSKNGTDLFFVIPANKDADCNGLFKSFEMDGGMVTGADGVEYGPFKISMASPRYGIMISKEN